MLGGELESYDFSKLNQFDKIVRIVLNLADF